MDAWILIAVLAVVVVAAAWWTPRGRRRQSKPPAQRTEKYTQVAPPAKFMGPVPKPDDRSPLTPFLAKALDRMAPVATGGGESVPWTDDEIKGVLARVVGRINARSNLDLVVVAYDGVTKTVDAYKTLRYGVAVHLHSPTKMMSSKVSVGVDVGADGKDYIRELRVHGAAKDKDDDIPGSGSLAAHDQYAPFEPAVLPF